MRITYPGTNNFTDFTFDALGRNAKIVETTAGSVTSTKQFVWCGSSRCEERDSSGSLTRQFFSSGETISGTVYFFAKDHLGSIREMSHMSGRTPVLDSQFSFDPFGNRNQIAGTGAIPDFSFATMYIHSRSSLGLTLYRAYAAGLGRWLSRDPIQSIHDPNPYNYVKNNPITRIDPDGDQLQGLLNPQSLGLLAGALASAALLADGIRRHGQKFFEDLKDSLHGGGGDEDPCTSQWTGNIQKCIDDYKHNLCLGMDPDDAAHYLEICIIQAQGDFRRCRANQLKSDKDLYDFVKKLGHDFGR